MFVSAGDLVNHAFDEQIDTVGLIRVGIMSGVVDPLDRYTGVFVPGLVVTNARTRAIILSADQQGGAVDFVKQIRLYCIGQHSIAMACDLRVSRPVTIVGHHHFSH